jgi:hypothetical protein
MCNHIEEQYFEIRASDVVLAKAVALSELALMAKAEIRLRQYLAAVWNNNSKKAIGIAVKCAYQMKNHTYISDLISEAMSSWKRDVMPTFNVEVRQVYRLARIIGYKKANRDTSASLQFNTPHETGVLKAKMSAMPTFDIVDDEAIKALEDNNTFWVGGHYSRNVSSSISKATKDVMIKAGNSPKVAAEIMRTSIAKTLEEVATPRGFIGTSNQYFEGLVANAMTVARVQGQLRSFADVGIRRYTIVNPGGSRICEVCAHMQGKTFTLEQGLKQTEIEFSSNEPDDIRTFHPWLGLGDMKKISPNPGDKGDGDSKALAEAGLSLPPYHYRCRCTIDVSDETLSFDNLRPMEYPSRERDGTVKPFAPKALPNFKTTISSSKYMKNFRAVESEITAHGIEYENIKSQAAAKIVEKLKNSNSFKEVVDDLGEKNAQDAVEKLLYLWGRTSGDSNSLAIVVQLAAQEEFGLTTAAVSHMPLSKARKSAGKLIPGLREFLRAQYNVTQETLKNKGIEELYVMRGQYYTKKMASSFPKTHFNSSTRKIRITQQPLSSWSTNPSIAGEFANGGQSAEYGSIMAARVPASRVIGIAKTGYGEAYEYEVVVLGSEDDVTFYGFGKKDATLQYFKSEDVLEKISKNH